MLTSIFLAIAGVVIAGLAFFKRRKKPESGGGYSNPRDTYDTVEK
jgi:LPXTG-motif cell wall-anchored protein